MLSRLARPVVNFLKDDSGPTAVEYAIMMVLIMVVCIVSFHRVTTRRIAQVCRTNASAPDCWYRVEVSDKMKHDIRENMCAESQGEGYGASVF